jgi:hypothetical protein
MLRVFLQFDGLSLVPVAFVSLFLLIGLAILGYGLLSFRTYAKIRLRSPTDAHAVDSGAVEVEGEAKAGERLLEAPFTGESCVAYEFEVEKYRHDDDGSNWHTRAEGAEVVPFRIADGTGVVGVEPSESSLSVDRDYRVVVGREETPPERVQAFVDGRDDLDHDTGSFDLGPVSIGTGDKHRFTERRLEPGMEAYVTGSAEPMVAVDGATPTVGDTGGGGVLDRVLGEPFVVADAGEDEVQWRYLKLGVGATLFGGVFAAIPIYVLFQAVLG